MEVFRISDGYEKSWVYENQERLAIQKKRETNGLTGFSVADNLVVCNKEVLTNVNKKIEKLKMIKKSQEVNHEIKKKKTEKRYDKQMKHIEKELYEELDKQSKQLNTSESAFTKEKDRLV